MYTQHDADGMLGTARTWNAIESAFLFAASHLFLRDAGYLHWCSEAELALYLRIPVLTVASIATDDVPAKKGIGPAPLAAATRAYCAIIAP